MAIKFQVLNRWSGKCQFEAEIACDETAPARLKMGLAVKWAYKSDAVLSGADLRGAVLSDADLSGADLRGAYLRGAVLSDADLSGAVLSGAVLSGAVLSGADLRGAVLSGAVLSGADLSGAVLSGADLRSFKADMWMTLTENPGEVPALIKSLREGKVDGSQYEGECACLVGTIAKAKGVSYDKLTYNSNNPAEQWFMMIRKGDKPGDDTGGGFAAKMALEWAEEFCRLHGIAVEAA